MNEKKNLFEESDPLVYSFFIRWYYIHNVHKYNFHSGSIRNTNRPQRHILHYVRRLQRMPTNATKRTRMIGQDMDRMRSLLVNAFFSSSLFWNNCFPSARVCVYWVRRQHGKWECFEWIFPKYVRHQNMAHRSDGYRSTVDAFSVSIGEREKP